MVKAYSEQEKTGILRDLKIQLLNGMLNSKQAAQVWTKRAEIEFGQSHEYDDNSVRWRVKSGDLKAAGEIHKHMNLFNIDDIFAIELMPQKGRKRKEKKTQEEQPFNDAD